MKKQDVINEFTSVVREYLNRGFSFLPVANRGTQGQEMAVVLFKGDEGLAISLFEQDVPVDGSPYSYFEDSLVIYIEVFSVSEWRSKDGTFWLANERDYKVTIKTVYYNVTNGRGDQWFTLSKHEAERDRAKRVERFVKSHKSTDGKHNNNKRFESESAKELALKVAKRTPGFKRAKLEDIKSFHKSLNGYSKVAYFIEFNVNSKFGCKKLALDKNLQKVAC